ncbi:MAG TPA: M56 family metallopeptidase [Terriglobia bacterium]|nr:M56 family metallopeptidase [Terriglobia bacterium]
MLHQPLWLRDLAAYCLQVAAIVIAGSVLPTLLRLHVPKVKLIYWQTLLAACLLLPLIEPWQQGLLPLYGIAGRVSIQMDGIAATSAGRAFSLPEIVLAVMLGGILFRAVWIALGLRRLRLYRERATPLPEKLASIDEAHRLASVYPPVFISIELKAPATFGFRSPVVLLPKRFLQMPASQQKAIACHELLHVRRRDWAWNTLEEFILALLWFHPAIWWVVQNIRLSREQTVDAGVVRRTECRQAYLSALLELAQQDLGRRSVPAPMFLREGQLAQRVSSIVKEVSMSRFRLIFTCFAAAATLTLTGGAAVRAFPLQAPNAAPGKVAFESGVSGGIAGGVAGGIEGGVPGGVGGDSSTTVHRVDVKQLKGVYNVVPPYPVEAKKARVQGKVLLDIKVNKAGEVTEEKVVSGPPMLVKSALNAVRQWRYAPSPLLPARTRVTVNYTLANTPSKPASQASDQAGQKHTTSVVENPGLVLSFTLPLGLKLIHAVAPSYPPLAWMARIQANVVLGITVDHEGKVSNISVISGHPLLVKAAIDDVSQWKFAPPANAPVEARVTIPFRLPPEESSPARAESYQLRGKEYNYISKVYTIGGDVQAPELVYSPDPPYTPEARNAKLSGDIILSTVISDEGKVVSVKEVSKPLGKGLDENALKTIPTWEFKPAERNGKPVPVRMQIDVSFRLLGGEKTGPSA